MRGCGTTFKDDPDEDDEALYEAVEHIAAQWELRAAKIRSAILHCRTKRDTKGLIEMVAYNFNANAHTPNFGGGAQQLMPVKGLAVMVDAVATPETKDRNGGMLVLELVALEGPQQGKKQMLRFNLWNTNPKTVKISEDQLSAVCVAMDRIQWTDTDQLKGGQFRVDIDWQSGHEPGGPKGENGGYTEVTAVYNMNGQKPGDIANGPQGGGQQQQQQFGGGQQQFGGGNQNQQPNNNGGFNNQNQNQNQNQNFGGNQQQNDGGNGFNNGGQQQQQNGGGWNQSQNQGGQQQQSQDQSQNNGGGNNQGWSQNGGGNQGGGNGQGWNQR